MEEEDDMEDGDLEELDGEGLNGPFFFLKSARSTGASCKKKVRHPAPAGVERGWAASAPAGQTNRAPARSTLMSLTLVVKTWMRTWMGRTWMERTGMARIEIRKWMVMEKTLAATKVDQSTMTFMTSAMKFVVRMAASAIINQQQTWC